MLNAENSVVIIIDIQEKLVKAASNGSQVVKKASNIVKAANLLSIPIILSEQYPKGLGSTVEELKNSLADSNHIVKKNAFSALSEPDFKTEICSIGRKQAILCGIETHICVLQTALALLEEGYEVFVIKDCCSSRNEFEHNTGLELLKQYGIKVTCTEIVLFELLKSSKHPKFKEIQALIK